MPTQIGNYDTLPPASPMIQIDKYEVYRKPNDFLVLVAKFLNLHTTFAKQNSQFVQVICEKQ
jgi:hypothetical protein